jgi:hypothetical protein
VIFLSNVHLQILCKRDCAHILLKNEERQTNAEERVERANILLALMRYKIESHLLIADVQYCGTPGCCGILNKKMKEEDMFPADKAHTCGPFLFRVQ